MGATYLSSPSSSRSPHLRAPTTLPLPLMAVAVVVLLVVVAVIFPDVGGQVETPRTQIWQCESFTTPSPKSGLWLNSPQNSCFNCTFHTCIFTLIVFNFNRCMLYNDIFEFWNNQAQYKGYSGQLSSIMGQKMQT